RLRLRRHERPARSAPSALLAVLNGLLPTSAGSRKRYRRRAIASSRRRGSQARRFRRGQYAELMKPNERLAVIDLGSNSFRLVVFMAGEGWWKRTDELYEAVRVGEGLARNGRLADRPMRRALATLDVFAHLHRADGVAGE